VTSSDDVTAGASSTHQSGDSVYFLDWRRLTSDIPTAYEIVPCQKLDDVAAVSFPVRWRHWKENGATAERPWSLCYNILLLCFIDDDCGPWWVNFYSYI